MRKCGIELKSNYAILSVLEFENDDIVDYIDLKIKKIALDDDENQGNIKDFFKEVNDFLHQNKIEKIIIKKRSKKGNFAGGAVTFKMESLIQFNDICEVSLISSQTISSFEKKNMIIFPSKLKKYQEQSYLAILASL